MPRGKRDNARAATPAAPSTAAHDAAAERATPAESTPADAMPDAQPAHPDQTQALSAFFRELATRAERDPAFGAGLLSVAQTSGLSRLSAQGASGEADASNAHGATAVAPTGPSSSAPPADANPPAPGASQKGKRGRPHRTAVNAPTMTNQPGQASEPAPDPFAVMRAQGEMGLRATLDALDLPTLRQIVRAHRLDPARISARWANRDRVIALIVDQTRARLNHGRAFERV